MIADAFREDRRLDLPSMVGSYSSTKCDWINCIVRADFPTPPPPTTTSLYSLKNWDWEQKVTASWSGGLNHRTVSNKEGKKRGTNFWHEDCCLDRNERGVLHWNWWEIDGGFDSSRWRSGRRQVGTETKTSLMNFWSENRERFCGSCASRLRYT